MLELTLQRIGDSVGIALPEGMCKRLQLDAGARVLLLETHEGLRLIPSRLEIERQMRAAKQVIQEYGAALRELGR